MDQTMQVGEPCIRIRRTGRLTLLALLCVGLGIAPAVAYRNIRPAPLDAIDLGWVQVLPEVRSELERRGFRDTGEWWVRSASSALLQVPGDAADPLNGTRVVRIPLSLATALIAHDPARGRPQFSSWPLYQGLQGTRYVNDLACFAVPENLEADPTEWSDVSRFLLLTYAFPIGPARGELPRLEDVWRRIHESTGHVPEHELQRALVQSVVWLESQGLPTSPASPEAGSALTTWQESLSVTRFLAFVARVCEAKYPEAQWWRKSPLLLHQLETEQAEPK